MLLLVYNGKRYETWSVKQVLSYFVMDVFQYLLLLTLVETATYNIIWSSWLNKSVSITYRTITGSTKKKKMKKDGAKRIQQKGEEAMNRGQRTHHLFDCAFIAGRWESVLAWSVIVMVVFCKWGIRKRN